MQKVVGSSPIIRSKKKPRRCGAFVVSGLPPVGDDATAGQVYGQVWSGSAEAALGGARENGSVPLRRFAEVVGVDAHRHVRFAWPTSLEGEHRLACMRAGATRHPPTVGVPLL